MEKLKIYLDICIFNGDRDDYIDENYDHNDKCNVEEEVTTMTSITTTMTVMTKKLIKRYYVLLHKLV